MFPRHKTKQQSAATRIDPEHDATDSNLASLLHKALPSAATETDKDPIPELQEIWQEAYDHVAKSEGGDLRSKVEKFEAAIRSKYQQSDAGGGGGNDSSNSLVSDLASLDSTRRQDLMAKLMGQRGNESKGAKAVSGIISVFDSTQEAIGTLLDLYQPASIAWAGICLVIAPLSNFAKAVDDNGAGIAYITGKLPENIELIEHLRSKPWKSREGTQKFKLTIRNNLVQLYRLIIEYQVLTFHACHSKSAIMKSSLGLAKWKEKLDGIKSAEAQLDKVVDLYYRTQTLDKSDETNENVVATLHFLKEKDQSKKRNALIEAFNPEISDLDYEAYQEYLNRLATPHQGTNQGIIDSPEFQGWMRAREARLLLLLGNPGTGKSVFSKALEHALQHITGKSSSPSTISSFFFKDKSGQQNRVNLALCKILYDLFKNREDLIDDVQDIVNPLDKNSLRLNTDMLWEIFIAATQSAAPDSVIVIFDAVDEINQNQLMDFLEKLRRFSNQAVKIFATARPIQPILDMFTPQTYHGIPVVSSPPVFMLDLEYNRSLYDDIVKVANDRLAAFFKDKRIWDQETRATLRQQLESYLQNNRTYLFVELVFRYLKGLKQERVARHWIRKFKSLPSSVYDTYSTLLETTQEEDRTYVKTMLQLTLAARRPLELREMNAALGILEIDADDSFDDRDYLDSNANVDDPSPSDDFRAWILDKCQFFLIVYNDGIYFIHQTVRDYLLSSGNDDKRPTWLASDFSELTCHEVMMKSCIKYMSIPRELDFPLRSMRQLFDASQSMQHKHFEWFESVMEDEYAFGEYSFTNWFFHANLIRKKEDKKWPGMIDALKKKYPSMSFDLAWFVFCCSSLPSANGVRVFKETSIIDSMIEDVDLALSCLSLGLVKRCLDIDFYEDLSYAIDLEKEVIARSDPDDERLAQRLLNLSDVYLLQARRNNSDTAASLSIEHVDRAIKMIPRTHANRRRALGILAVALNLRFCYEKDDKDIKRAIDAIENALDPNVYPPTEDEKYYLKQDHKICLTSLFRYSEFRKAAGDNEDDDRAIETARVVVDKFSQLHHASPSERLMVLASLFEEYAKRKRTKQHIDAAIQAFHGAFEITPVENSDRVDCLYSMAVNMHFRYTCLGSKEDLTHAFSFVKTLYSLIAQSDSASYTKNCWYLKLAKLKDGILRDVEKLKEDEEGGPEVETSS
ncbi:hypothetical protein UA08_05179 [Talaromyces atroroseus]|uniref:Uncharacterized protein n=1 Tax=Talaromyces atroroseus TaxID=1441469 RepID=A0A225AJM9_TALAT|nr:hypothetical protein UA08_05179 [Talaromyces atroroseus]OKL59573.1 hypothetical protein UA08_05179 [Talaromyces atroroseus]